VTRKQLSGTFLTFLALAGYLAVAFAAGWVPREEKCSSVPYEVGARPTCVEVKN
jgi:hypothetical protein